jgi:hypothetical protein
MRYLRLKPTEIATSCPVDGRLFKINQRIQILPAQTDSAREQNPTIKTSEEELATIYLTPLRCSALGCGLSNGWGRLHPSSTFSAKATKVERLWRTSYAGWRVENGLLHHNRPGTLCLFSRPVGSGLRLHRSHGDATTGAPCSAHTMRSLSATPPARRHQQHRDRLSCPPAR